MNTSMSTIERWITGGPVGLADVERVRDKVLFDRPPVANRYSRFIVLLALATVIGTGGVIVDSTATVIGAMIVAPLMTPIMATAVSTVTGDRRSIARSALIVLVGAVGVVALSWGLTRLLPGGVDTLSNPQVNGRTTVGLIELTIALASGAAGAFGIMRDDISDALPGVAIAISLVPPLCVVGICTAVGSYGQALAALLLFATNAVAILVAGGTVFTLAGFGRVTRTSLDLSARRTAVVATAVATVFLLVPLAGTTYRLSQDAIIEHRIHPMVEQWLGDGDYALESVTVNGSQARIVLEGAGARPTSDDLPGFISPVITRPLTVDLELRPREVYRYVVEPD
jgi:uncharacterized hydrophobic protein (TIGR00271 family)